MRTTPHAAKPFAWSVPDATVNALISRVELLVLQRDARGRPIVATVKGKLQ